VDILFVHQNMPGQFRHLARSLAANADNRVVFLGKRTDLKIPNVRAISYPSPKAAARETHAYLNQLETAVRHGQAVARKCIDLRASGFSPRLVLVHPGWGEALFLRDIWPDTRIISYAEFYYRGSGADIGFDPDHPASLDTVCKARVRNSHLILSLEASDAAISPTHWQKSVHPDAFQSRIRVIFDGIDTAAASPDAAARFELADGRTLGCSDEVITYVARNLEPYRGFPPAMHAIAAVLDARPACEAVIVGGDEVSYGSAPRQGGTWRSRMMAEAGLDRFAGRLHFMGKIPYARYLALLQISSVHLYLTYPFVLSWSCLEAMSAGCLLVASDTAPVREVIEDGHNGLFVPFGDVPAIAARLIEALSMGDGAGPIRAAARATVLQRYDLAACLAAQHALVDEVLR
jgi:glycosyltransferase involved in cell wall biosynthesis